MSEQRRRTPGTPTDPRARAVTDPRARAVADTRERFLREIAAQVPADRIAEVHLFRPMRRGGTETGVAVIAAVQTGADQSSTEVTGSGATPRSADDVADSPAAMDTSGESLRAAGDAEVPLPPPVPEGDATDLPDDPIGAPDPGPTDALPAQPSRHTVFTARYRLELKGAERGRWEFDVVADADAPLVTVDSVVRGVQRRAGDHDEPERLSADAVRAALDGQPWTGTR